MQTLIDYYKAIETTSVRMVEAARSENWDEVVRLEGACAVLIEQLRHESRSQVLSATQRAEKNRIMLSILRHDAQIRSLAEPLLSGLSLRDRAAVLVAGDTTPSSARPAAWISSNHTGSCPRGTSRRRSTRRARSGRRSRR